MKKMRFLSVVMAFIMLFGMIMGGQAVSAASPEGDFTFDGAGTIIGYTGVGGTVEIPSTIGGISVTAIGAEAFRDKSAITGISIPDSVTSIGSLAFYSCTNLKSISVPIHATTVASCSFQYCNTAESITIPEGVKAIEDRAFFGCKNNESIVIPSTVTSIGDFAFSAEQDSYYTPKLSQAFFTGAAPTMGIGVFKIVDTDFKIYYPNDKTAGYTDSWSKCASGSESSGCTLVAYDPAAEYTVIYNGNGSTSGSVPADNSKYKTTNVVTVSGNNTLTKENYIFDSWNTEADGTGLSYDPGDQFVMGAGNVTLYAQWIRVYKINKGSIAHGSISTTINGVEIDTLDENHFRKSAPKITVTLTPENGYRYKPGTLQYNDGTKDVNISGTSFTMPASDVTVTAVFEAIPSSDGSNDTETTGTGSGNAGAGKGTVTVTETSASGNMPHSVTGAISPEVESDSNGNASAAVTESQVADAVNKAVDAAAEIGGNTLVKVEIKVDAPVGLKTVETSIPKAALDKVAGSKADSLAISTPVATLTFDSKALDSISGEAAGEVKVTMSKVDTPALPDEVKQMVGDRPVFDFSVTSGDKTISQFGGNVTVSIPYTPRAGEDANAIVIYYINAEGKLEMVANCAYDPATGRITFKTNHFSKYTVGYNKVSFNDVDEKAWYGSAVDFVAARGITTGTGNGCFSPEDKLSRGQFLVMVMKAYGIDPDEDLNDNFTDAGNTYYTGYLAAAKKLGITTGIGNNMFAPEKEITRQEMFTLMYNILEQSNELPTGTTGKTLTSYNDADEIASWAQDAMSLFVGTGTISGSGDRLNPADTTTRAEMAQVLYKLLAK